MVIDRPLAMTTLPLTLEGVEVGVLEGVMVGAPLGT